MELKSKSGWLWLSVSVVLVSAAQLLLKFGIQQLPPDQGLAAYLEIIAPANIVPIALPIVLGLGGYVISVLCWIGTLARLPLSMAYPSLALSYLLVYAGAMVLPAFDEKGSAIRLGGILLVIAGVWLVSLQGKAPNDSH
ncbi:MAG TPA: 4-amino-4-deoxy-L-arabinose-phosphoundecaprenol flippase subunit ArnF [Pseudomonadales bacterium]|nr:4-amino-4-deoxy-L-arabinose-phosphoundecaprenol flippase subunit ArnF [Pseudomonadales bacterium]